MTTKTFYPNNVTQTTGTLQANFQNLQNIKTSAKYAQAQIKEKNSRIGRTPALVTVNNFKMNIPQYARIDKITVTYGHWHSDGINLPSPTITLRYGNTSIAHKKGKAPTRGGIKLYDTTFTNIGTRTQLNSSTFSIAIQYGANTKNSTGTLYLSSIRITVTYTLPKFTIALKKISGGYNHEEFVIDATLNNIENIGTYSPTMTILAPPGFTFKEKRSGPGTHTKVNARTITWKPNITSKSHAKSYTARFVYTPNVTYESGSTEYHGTFSSSLNWNSVTKSLSVVVTERPVSETVPSTGDGEPKKVTPEVVRDVLVVSRDEEFKLDLNWDDTSKVLLYACSIDKFFTDDESTLKGNQTDTPKIYVYHPRITEWTWDSISYYDQQGQYWSPTLLTLDEMGVQNNVKIPTQGNYAILVYDYSNNVEGDLLQIIKIHVRPNSIQLPASSFLELTTEELDRLGDGYNYTVQSMMKLITNEPYVRDDGHNFRIGVFNNQIEDNVTKYINFDTDEESQLRTLQLPYTDDITGANLILSSDKSLIMVIDETEYEDTANITLDSDEYLIPCTFQKVDDDEVNVTAQLKKGSSVLSQINYIVRFNAEESQQPYDSETDTTDYSNLSESTIFSKADYWSEPFTQINEFESIECEFTYDKKYPLYILFTGDHPNGSPTKNYIHFIDPCIIETDTFEERLPNGNFPTPITNLIEESIADTTINGYEVTNGVILYDFPLPEDFSTNDTMAIRGIELKGDIENNDEIVLTCILRDPQDNIGNRSLVLNEYVFSDTNPNEFIIGGNGDLWGFGTLDIQSLDKWELELQANNLLSDEPRSINFGNLTLGVYTEEITTQNINIQINGEDISLYGAFIQSLTIPQGLNTDTSFLTIDGTDTNDAYRQNIREKTIEMELEVGTDCDLEASTQSLRQLTKLLQNEKDQYNRPIPKIITFSHLPDVYAEYIITDEIDTELDITTYTIKPELIIPAGTFYSIDSLTTNSTGIVQGVANISPIITIMPNSSTIEITENNTDQKFNMGFNGDWTNKIVEIDCEDRQVWLYEDEDDDDPIELTRYVDFNSDWFSLLGEYEFSTVNCTLRTVSFEERW